MGVVQRLDRGELDIAQRLGVDDQDIESLETVAPLAKP